jgi:hypothetical protein
MISSSSSSTGKLTGKTVSVSLNNKTSKLTCFEDKPENLGAVFGFVTIMVRGNSDDFLVVK